jgi:hypothetical protein
VAWQSIFYWYPGVKPGKAARRSILRRVQQS